MITEEQLRYVKETLLLFLSTALLESDCNQVFKYQLYRTEGLDNDLCLTVDDDGCIRLNLANPKVSAYESYYNPIYYHKFLGALLGTCTIAMFYIGNTTIIESDVNLWTGNANNYIGGL